MQKGDSMNKRKLLSVVCIIVIVLVALGVVTQVKTTQVEHELKDTSAYLNLVTSYDGLSWKKTNLFFITDFEIHAMGTQSYCITPVWSGFIAGAVNFGIEKLEHFPEDIWAQYDSLGGGSYYYPGSCGPKNVWEDNEYLAVSFDRPYTIEEVMEVEELAAARWFWIDTLGEENVSNEEYSRSLTSENCAYGVTSELDELPKSCEAWISCLNSYDKNSKTESGRKIYEIKGNIKEGDNIQLEDIRILGCEVCAFGYEAEKEKMKDNPMFHVVRSIR